MATRFLGFLTPLAAFALSGGGALGDPASAACGERVAAFAPPECVAVLPVPDMTLASGEGLAFVDGSGAVRVYGQFVGAATEAGGGTVLGVATVSLPDGSMSRLVTLAQQSVGTALDLLFEVSPSRGDFVVMCPVGRPGCLQGANGLMFPGDPGAAPEPVAEPLDLTRTSFFDGGPGMGERRLAGQARLGPDGLATLAADAPRLDVQRNGTVTPVDLAPVFGGVCDHAMSRFRRVEADSSGTRIAVALACRTSRDPSDVRVTARLAIVDPSDGTILAAADRMPARAIPEMVWSADGRLLALLVPAEPVGAQIVVLGLGHGP